jgi:hypothetical protein
MRRLFKFLGIIQHKIVAEKGRFRTLKRLNPFHPLTYVVMVIGFIVALFMFGFVGVWKEVNWKELLFKWV